MSSSSFWFIALGVSYFLAALQIFALYRFKSIEWLLIIEKRYPKLVIVESVGVSLYLVFGHTLFTKALLAQNYMITIPVSVFSFFGNAFFNWVMVIEVQF